MKKSLLIALCITVVLSFCGCGADKPENKDVSENQTAEVDLSGDKNVPKTETELVGGDIEEYKSLEEMEKEVGNIILPDMQGYQDVKYLSEDGIAAVVYTDKDGKTVSFRKGDNVSLSVLDSSYSIVYGGNIDGKSVTYGSRGSENLAGVAIWNTDDNYYKIETMQWEELTKDEMETLIKNFS